MLNRKLSLERPLVVFDLETTGLDVNNDRIVEISCVKLGPDGSRDVRTRRINPGVPISPSAVAVHGIRDEDVAQEPGFAKVARSLFEYLDGCDLSGFNVEHFDLPLLVKEFERAGLAFPHRPVRVVDTWKIFLTKEPRGLAGAYRFYCGKELEGAHGAEADALAAAEVLLSQVQRYPDLPTGVGELHEFCHPVHPDWIDPEGRIVWRGDEAALGFGKHRDRTLRAMAAETPDYLRWMAGANFSPEVVAIVKAALGGEFPSRQGAESPARPLTVD